VTDADIARFIYREARLLDEKRWDEWYDLFTEDGHYWVPLTRNQPDAEFYTSLAYEDRLLLRLRIERLRRQPPSQHPQSWSQHVLQAPEIEAVDRKAPAIEAVDREAPEIEAADREAPEIEAADGESWITRTAFHYAEARGDAMQTLSGVALHELVRQDGALRIRLKRINLLNCDAALPSIQLFL
jgi:3-phenylpropionate/cinnamic acid dioxygenase small subunit